MNLYVSNLGFHTADDDLRKLFEKFGTVLSAKVISDRETGRSRGFGFVEMNDNEEAIKAINGLNGKDLEGRMISVSEAREKAPRQDKRRF
ncbi:MAG TPA: RNA-binding protein [Chitinophagaceae bacterium]|nr:RNA-binding protein [Chitinophagaceae bacterium]